MFFKIGVLKDFVIFTGKHLWILQKRNRSFIKLLKKIGPNMELCGTPVNKILTILSALYFLNLTLCCLLFKEEYKDVKDSVANPCAWSFAVISHEGCNQTH